MTILQSIFLGILQGIAEFLPISSSGHLAIVQALFGLDEVPLLFDVFLHLATLFAVCIFFWKQIWALLCVFGRWITRKATDDDKPALITILALVLGTCVTGVFGIVLQKLLPEMPTKVICGGFLVTAALLIVSSRVKFSGHRIKSDGQQESTDSAINTGNVSVKQGLFLGFAQGIGVLPGISRSGITISAGLFAGLDRKTAGEFSFLLSIPAILGAFVLELKDLGEVSTQVGILPLIIGCLCAFVAGFAALKFLMAIIKKGKLEWFAVYLIPVGIAGILFL